MNLPSTPRVSWAEESVRRRRRRRRRPQLTCAMCSKVCTALFGDGSLRMLICASCWMLLRGTATPPIIKRSRSWKRENFGGSPEASVRRADDIW
jgi:hypothetical protein